MRVRKLGAMLIMEMLTLGLLGRVGALTISPTYQIFHLTAGKQMKGECNLLNNEPTDLTITPSVKDWFVLPGNETFSSTDWLLIDTKPFVLKPGESRKITFKIKSPEGAAGELVGMLSFEMMPPEKSMLHTLLSVAIYVSDPVTEKLDAALDGVGVRISTGAVDMAVMLSNKGNIHIRPNGKIQILNAGKVPLHDIYLEGDTRPTYPGRQNSYGGRIDNFNLQQGTYTVKIDLTDADHKQPLLKAEKVFVVHENNKVQIQ